MPSFFFFFFSSEKHPKLFCIWSHSVSFWSYACVTKSVAIIETKILRGQAELMVNVFPLAWDSHESIHNFYPHQIRRIQGDWNNHDWKNHVVLNIKFCIVACKSGSVPKNVDLRTWFSGGLCSAGLMAGLEELRDLLQSEWFYVSMVVYKISLERYRIWERCQEKHSE